jgi:tetratricopeptide (TPR) repeat protein
LDRVVLWSGQLNLCLISHVAYLYLGQFEEAKQDADRAIEIDPLSFDAVVIRGVVYDNTGRSMQAVIDFDQALRLNPQLTEVYFKRGIAHAEAVTDMHQVVIGAGALTSVAEVVRQTFGDRSAVVSADENAFAAVGRAVQHQLLAARLNNSQRNILS